MADVNLVWRAHGTGTAPTMVMLHGSGLGPSTFDAVLPALTARFRVLVPELPGYGRTPRQRPCDLAAQEQMIVSDLDEMGVARPIVVGHSLGGHRALSLALARPVSSLFVVSGFASVPMAAALAAGAATLRADAETLLGAQRAMYAPAFRAAHPARVEAQLAHTLDARVVADELDACGALPDLTPRLAALSLPTHVRCGELDQNAPPELSRAIAAAIPGATLTLVPGCAHALCDEETDAIIAWLLDAPATSR